MAPATTLPPSSQDPMVLGPFRRPRLKSLVAGPGSWVVVAVDGHLRALSPGQRLGPADMIRGSLNYFLVRQRSRVHAMSIRARSRDVMAEFRVDLHLHVEAADPVTVCTRFGPADDPVIEALARTAGAVREAALRHDSADSSAFRDDLVSLRPLDGDAGLFVVIDQAVPSPQPRRFE